MKEEYQNIKEALGKLCYMEHQWVICVDLKMVNFLLGQQSRCIKYPCFYVFGAVGIKHSIERGKIGLLEKLW